jgi:hypothetical protein
VALCLLMRRGHPIVIGCPDRMGEPSTQTGIGEAPCKSSFTDDEAVSEAICWILVNPVPTRRLGEAGLSQARER